jgi:ribose-phosphate pyrophosphokinase
MIKINGKPINPYYFPDGTLKLDFILPENVNTNDIVLFEWYFDNNEELIILEMLVKHIRANYFFKRFHLHMPYIPNARFDRTKNDTEIFTLKWFCEAINNMDFEVVRVLHPHSNVSTALLDNIVVDKGNENIIDSLIKNLNPTLIYFPDEGCKKNLGDSFKYPFLFGIKNRDWQTGQIKGLEIMGEVPENSFDVLIVDDICSKGGTFYHSAKKLKELGAGNIYLYITHCENSILEGELINSGLITKIYTTDTIFTKEHELIEVLTNFRGEK